MVRMQNKDRRVFYAEKPAADRAEELNKLDCRFDICDFNDEFLILESSLQAVRLKFKR